MLERTAKENPRIQAVRAEYFLLRALVCCPVARASGNTAYLRACRGGRGALPPRYSGDVSNHRAAAGLEHLAADRRHRRTRSPRRSGSCARNTGAGRRRAAPGARREPAAARCAAPTARHRRAPGETALGDDAAQGLAEARVARAARCPAAVGIRNPRQRGRRDLRVRPRCARRSTHEHRDPQRERRRGDPPRRARQFAREQGIERRTVFIYPNTPQKLREHRGSWSRRSTS